MKSFVDFVNENIDEKFWYHGSYNDNISTFITRRRTNRLGIYFSDVEKESKRYGSNIYVVKLHLEKTLDLSKYGEQGYDNYENFLDELPIPEKEKDYLKREHKNWGRDYFTPYIVLEILDLIHFYLYINSPTIILFPFIFIYYFN